MAKLFCKIMVRRSARLRNKDPPENSGETEGLGGNNGQETLENLAKTTYQLIKEKVAKNRENCRSDVVVEREDGTGKPEEFISISSRMKDNVPE